jgi:hypothetical protein
VDPVPENLVGLGIEPGTSESVARNSDHYTTEVSLPMYNNLFKCITVHECHTLQYFFSVTPYKGLKFLTFATTLSLSRFISPYEAQTVFILWMRTACPDEAEAYAGGSIATGRSKLIGPNIEVTTLCKYSPILSLFLPQSIYSIQTLSYLR